MIEKVLYTTPHIVELGDLRALTHTNHSGEKEPEIGSEAWCEITDNELDPDWDEYCGPDGINI
jgi:hypothetical protein